MHWTEKRRGVANIGKGLEAKGWVLFGWHDDQSDAMTDYYHPESWDGLAVKNGYIVVVNDGPGPYASREGENGRPDHLPNPPNTNWHVEKDGKILTSGVGIGPCADYDKKRAEPAVARIVDRIEWTIGNRPEATAENVIVSEMKFKEGAIVRQNKHHNGIEVVFPSREAYLRSGVNLKRVGLGFRWSRNQGLWYTKFSEYRWQKIRELLAVEEKEEEPEEEIVVAEPVQVQPESTPVPQVDEEAKAEKERELLRRQVGLGNDRVEIIEQPGRGEDGVVTITKSTTREVLFQGKKKDAEKHPQFQGW